MQAATTGCFGRSANSANAHISKARRATTGRLATVERRSLTGQGTAPQLRH